MGGFEATVLLNPKSKAFRDAQVDLATVTSDEVYALIRNNPRMMKRPIFTNGEAIVVGFLEDDLEKKLAP